MPKDISQAEAISYGEKIKPVALALSSYAGLKASSSYIVSKSVENSVK